MHEKSERHAPAVLAIVPAYNEQASIGSVIRALKANLPGADICVIDDGSTDRTAELARAASAMVVRLPVNLGIGGAVQTGFLFAWRNGYDFALQVDADGQHPPAEARKILDLVLGGKADVAIGSRFLSTGGYKSSKSRRLGIMIFSRLVRALTGLRIADCTSGFRAYNRRALEFLKDSYPTDYPEVEAIVTLWRNGYRIVEIPVEMHDRRLGRSSITIPRAVFYMAKVSLASFTSVFGRTKRPRSKASKP